MKLIDKTFVVNDKQFAIRIHKGNKPEYVFVTHHGLISNRTSFRYFEKWIGERGIVIGYDARANGQSELRASRLKISYTNDLNDIVLWAKKRYPKLKIVVLGSSWGASVVVDFQRRFGDNVFKAIAWSIPYKFAKGEDAVRGGQNQITKSIVKGPSKWEYTWKFLVMILFNINTKTYTKVDIEKTADNSVLKQINRIIKPRKTSVKLFFAAWKHVLLANWNIKKINEKYDKPKLLYIQSTKDEYVSIKKLNQLDNLPKNGFNLVILGEGKHALQWERKNKLNERVFKMMLKWLK